MGNRHVRMSVPTKPVQMSRLGIVGELLATALPRFSLDVVGVVAGYLECKPLSHEDQMPKPLSLARASYYSTRLLKALVDRILFVTLRNRGGLRRDQKLVVVPLDMDSQEPLGATVHVPFPDDNSVAIQGDHTYVYSPQSGFDVYDVHGILRDRIPHQQDVDVSCHYAAFAVQEDTRHVFLHQPREERIVVLDPQGTRLRSLGTSFLFGLPRGHSGRIHTLDFQPTTGRLCVHAWTSVHLMDADGANVVRLRCPGDDKITRVDAMAMDRRGRIFVCLRDERMVVFDSDGIFCTSIVLDTFVGLQKTGGSRICVDALAIDVMERIWIDDGNALRIYGFVE